MSDDKSKDYDFDADDPFMDNPLEKSGAGSQEALSPEDFDDLSFDDEDLGQKSSAKTGSEDLQEDLTKHKKAGSMGMMDLLKEYYLYLIGGVVVLVIIYYMYTMIFPSTPVAQPVQNNRQSSQQSGFGLSTQPVQVPQKAVVKNTQQNLNQPTTVAPMGPPTLAFTQDDLKQMIDGFRGIVNESNDKLASQLATQLGQIETAQVKLIQEETSITTEQSKSISELNTNVQSLNQAIAQSNKSMSEISTALLRTQSQLKLLLAEKAQTRDQLVLRAVVPGRAWLIDAAGKTLSVAVGDEIADYGKVEQIDDKTASVIMSSGYVFN